MGSAVLSVAPFSNQRTAYLICRPCSTWWLILSTTYTLFYAFLCLVSSSLYCLSRHNCTRLKGLRCASCYQRRSYFMCRTCLLLRCWLAFLKCDAVRMFAFGTRCMCYLPRRLQRVPKLSPKAVYCWGYRYHFEMIVYRALGS